jgi:amino acid transporter
LTDHLVDNQQPELKRTLGLKDLVLFNIASIVAMSTLAQVAQFGYGSMPLYVLAIIAFLIPSGLVVSELNARMPEEGGFYLWTKTAFGDLHGYTAAWTYWVSNIVWLPTVLLGLVVSGLYLFGEDYLHLKDNAYFTGSVSLSILWLMTILNIVGLDKAKWIQNIGGIALWITFLLLFVFGGIYVVDIGSAHEFSAPKLIPDFTDFSLLPFFAMVAFCFCGFELGPIMAGEVKNPKTNVPRAILISSVVIGLIYMVGTLTLIVTVPEGEINIINGVAQSFFEFGEAYEIPGFGVGGVALVLISTMGTFGAWLAGTARLPFVVGLDRYLPDVVGKIHPRFKTPYVALMMQGLVMSILFLASIMGSTVEESFLILLDMSIILYYIPILYMFASMIPHHLRNTGGEGIIGIFKKRPALVWITVGLGFSITLFSTIIAAVPTQEIEDKTMFVVKVVGGAFVLVSLGQIVYFVKARSKSKQTAVRQDAR